VQRQIWHWSISDGVRACGSRAIIATWLLVPLACACGDDDGVLDAGSRDSGRVDGSRDASTDAGFDAHRAEDAAIDAGTVDASSLFDSGGLDSSVGEVDAGGLDAGFDGGFDGGRPDAGFDAGGPDAGFDGGFDAGAPDAGPLPDGGFDGGFDAGPIPPEYLGAWYGGAAPGGDFCIIVCETHRLFLSDHPCTEITHSDFRGGYWLYSVSGTSIVQINAAGTVVRTIELTFYTPDSASFRFSDGFEFIQTRMATTSPVCTDPTIRPR
jgi:hypothetical protein